MTTRRSFKGKVVSQTIWSPYITRSGKSIDIVNIEMTPSFAGTYYWNVKLRNVDKVLSYHGKFDKAVINGDQVSFFVSPPISVNGKKFKYVEEPFLVIKFDKGEVTRLLSVDRWFRSHTWFNVEIEELQLTIF